MRSVILFLLPIIAVVHVSAACPGGWWGDRCQFECYCKKGVCTENGTCPIGDLCAVMFFGPSCQYRNIAHAPLALVTLNRVIELALADTDDYSCVDASMSSVISVAWNKPQMFTWMRIAFKEYGHTHISPFEITFTTTDATIYKCLNKRHRLFNNSVHIYCDNRINIKQVDVQVFVATSLCSVYISGGRNIALKQKAIQSSTYMHYKAGLALDGDTKICSTSKFTKGWFTWTLVLPRAFMVHRYKIYSYSRAHWGGITNFKLTGIDRIGATVHVFKDPDKGYTDRFAYEFKFYPVSIYRVTVQKPPSAKQQHFAICELEVWGECPSGYYGLDCTNKCSDSCPDDCNVFDGRCGICVTTIACSQVCPKECLYDCDPETGECISETYIGAPAVVFLVICIVGLVLAAGVIVYSVVKRRANNRRVLYKGDGQEKLNGADKR